MNPDIAVLIDKIHTLEAELEAALAMRSAESRGTGEGQSGLRGRGSASPS
jgi:hypothetical protein